MMVFLNYLQLLKPLINHNLSTYASSDKTIQRVLNRPDFLFPFRQKAPMILQALQTIYSNKDRLYTSEGFWNILSYRGVLYGSEYATNNVRWFSSLEEWLHYFTTSTKEKEGEKEKYFVNIGAYGYNNQHRHTDCIKEYWNQSTRWTSFIQKNPTVANVYSFLLTKTSKKNEYRRVFPNIGPLAALLICGDLVEAGVLATPSIQEWTRIIHKVDKGGAEGLIRLNLLSQTHNEQEVFQAFNQLNSFLMDNLSEADQAMMGYNIIMLEHALCKFTRVTKRNTESIKKNKRKKRVNK
jgi:hypothetical protein